ncbi:MAG: AAA family ATPase [Faecalibacillus sp.]
MSKIITIAREYGSGGRIIAQQVAEKLGIIYYDNEIIDLAAQELGFDVRALREVSETKSNSFMYKSSFTKTTLSLHDQVFMMQSKVIRHLAHHDTCIIVNGIADDVLEDYEDVLKVFIHAPIESRVNRVKNEYHEEHDDCIKYVKKKDKQRRNYYNYYTTKKWGQLQNFDLTMNSDLGIDIVVDMIVKAYLK